MIYKSHGYQESRRCTAMVTFRRQQFYVTVDLTDDDHPRVAISRRRPLSGNCFRALTPCLPTSNGPSFLGPSGNVLLKGRALLLTADMKEIGKSHILFPKHVHHLFQHCSDPSQMVSEVIEFSLKLNHPCRPKVYPNFYTEPH